MTGAGKKRGSASSVYRGVSKHVSSGMYEAHVWASYDKVKRGKCSKAGQRYLGRFTTEEDAARAHDIARLKLDDPRGTKLNFCAEEYKDVMQTVQKFDFEDVVLRFREVRPHGEPSPAVTLDASEIQCAPQDGRRDNRANKKVRAAAVPPEAAVTVPEPWGAPAPTLWPSHSLPPLFERWTYDASCVYTLGCW